MQRERNISELHLPNTLVTFRVLPSQSLPAGREMDSKWRRQGYLVEARDRFIHFHPRSRE